MKWDQTGFLHLFIPMNKSPTVWDERKTLASTLVHSPVAPSLGVAGAFLTLLIIHAPDGQVDDIHIISGRGSPRKFSSLYECEIRPLP
jgi:hypothetical protein